MKFKSEYFDTVDELVKAKNEDWSLYEDRRERQKTIRRFVNMLPTMTPEEAEAAGRTEITNHGLTYKDMLQNETLFSSMTVGTNTLLEVIVDTDNPEQDFVTGQRISEIINRHAIHRKGKFSNFWKKVAGEIVIAGGAPVVMPEKYGWCPELRTNMFFPAETSLESDEVPYAWDMVKLSVHSLKKLAASSKEKFADKKAIDQLIEKIEEQIKNNTKEYQEDQTARSVREDKLRSNTTIDAFWFYEVKFKDSGESYVSATLVVETVKGILLTDRTDDGGEKPSMNTARVIWYREEAYSSASEFLHLACVDSEIGGIKDIDTLRGIAELIYPSGIDIEELLNLMMEGDKMRAKPRFSVGEGTSPDSVAKWDAISDLYVPAGLTELVLKNDSRGLQTPLALLTQNASGLSASSVSNGPQGGELRQQALERQQNNATVQNSRVSEGFNHMDSILENVVYRILKAPTKAGTAGYPEIMMIRSLLKKYGIDYEKLATRKYGCFEFIRVRAKRSIGNGDRSQQLETADWLMTQIQNFQPAQRPKVIRRAVALHTQDPDLADDLVKIPVSIINTQKLVAENEYDTIARRAALGQILPVGDDDVHQDQIPVHLLDMQAAVAKHSQRPWDKMDVLAFAGMAEHVGEHIKILLGNPATNAEGKVFVQDYQNIAQAAQAIVAEVEQREGSEQQQLTPKEQADQQIRWAQIELEGRKLGIKVEDTQRLWQSRASREALAHRQQYTREINEDRRLKLDDKRIEKQAEVQKARVKTAAKKKPAKS